nr:circadian clock protein KaiC [Chloroflexota bacterium]
LLRSAGIGIDLAAQIAAGRIQVRQVDPAELSPGEFVQEVRRAVEQNGSRILIIDSLNGYINAMPQERYLLIQLHELFTYLGQQGVTTFLVVAQHGLVGDMQSPIDASYLADTVILLRYFEARGEIRQAISVMKKRSGMHERTIRELRIDKGGVHVGPPLSVFQGVLNGTAQYIGYTDLVSEQPDGRTSE